ncbi:G-type lectin S-receptor-like serine/threonine-protein kinase, partial [Tanacetum coccineum]
MKRVTQMESARGASGATFTLVNECSFTVCPGISGTPGFNSTGFELMQNSSRSFHVTNSWDGVIWGRTNCTFNQFGQGSCITCDCGSHEMECFGRNTTSALTVASFRSKESISHLGWFKERSELNMKSRVYDVSQDSYNNDLWMSVEATGGSGPYQSKGCSGNMNDYSCTKSSASNWCHGANYTVKFCSRRDEFSIIKLGREIKSTNQLVSRGGLFTLGFFGTDYRYLGIWYTNDDQSRKVWVANPNEPIMVTSSAHALSIHPNTGNLIITVEGRTVMNITDVRVGPNPDVSTYIQETGRNLTLTSWLTNEIPHSGAFTLSWEPTDEASQRLMIRRRGQPYWTSGNLVNQRFPYLVASSDPCYDLTSVYNKEEQYFSYTPYTDLSMWILTPDGNITITDVIDASDRTSEFCYGYDSGDGCVKELSFPQCRTNYDNFKKRNGDFTSEMTRNDTDKNSSLSISDCFSKCWNNCSCVGFESNTNDGTGCVLWTGNLSFVVSPYQSSTWKYVISSQHLLSPSTAENRREKSMKRILIPVGAAILLIFLSLGLLRYIEKRKQRREEEEKRKRDAKFLELTASESFKDVHQLESIGGNGHNLLLFSFASIMTATCDFSVEKKLGQGGFGPVYMGILSDGREIAVKRLSRASRQGLVEFKNELILIAKLQHTNLVRIQTKSPSWIGLNDLTSLKHKYSRMRVIRRDLKANNILLDVSMNPKISDFGMARIFNPNETQAMTNRVVGTYGFMAPEYAMEGTFSIKSDIYSFGVVILEIVSGRRNSSFNHLGRTFNLLGYAWELWQQGDALDLEDPSVGSTTDMQQFLRNVHVALLCVQEDAMDRPTTSDMISMLLNDTTLTNNFCCFQWLHASRVSNRRNFLCEIRYLQL